MANYIIYPGGSQDILVTTGNQLTVSVEGSSSSGAKVFLETISTGKTPSFVYQQELARESQTYGPYTYDRRIRIEAGPDEVYASDGDVVERIISGKIVLATDTATSISPQTASALTVRTIDQPDATGAASSSPTITFRSGNAGSSTGGATGSTGGNGGLTIYGSGAGGNTNNTGADNAGSGGAVFVTPAAGGNATAGTGNGGSGGSIFLVPGNGGTSAGGSAGANGIITLGSAGNYAISYGVKRETIANAGSITIDQLKSGVLYQDASGGSVSMTLPTAANISAAFPDLATDNAISIIHSSNDTTNTSTLNVNTGITLIGSNSVTETGGRYTLIKTGANSYDLVRG